VDVQFQPRNTPNTRKGKFILESFVTTFRASESLIWGNHIVAGLGSQFRVVRGSIGGPEISRRDYVIQPSVAVTQARLRWGTAHSIYQLRRSCSQWRRRDATALRLKIVFDDDPG
jgi:hypothetical protein